MIDGDWEPLLHRGEVLRRRARRHRRAGARGHRLHDTRDLLRRLTCGKNDLRHPLSPKARVIHPREADVLRLPIAQLAQRGFNG